MDLGGSEYSLNFSKGAFGAKDTHFEGEARAEKKAIFWSTFSKKSKKFFSQSRDRVFIVIWESSKNYIGRPKKGQHYF